MIRRSLLGQEPKQMLSDHKPDPYRKLRRKTQQRRRQATDPRHQVGFELVDLGVQLLHACQELASEPGHHAVEAAEERLGGRQVRCWCARQRPSRRVP